MRAFRPRRACLAAVLALLAAGPAAAGDAAPPPASTTGRNPGVAAPAPEAAYDTLRYEAPAPAAVAPARAARLPMPLLLDTNDYGFGTTVAFDHLPSVQEIGELRHLTSVRHVVVTLEEWPGGFEQVQPLGQALLPEDCDLIVVMPGYPPSHAAAEAWNYLRLPLRIVLVVDGPPANRAGIDELNRIRGLERVIADMEFPSRTGFERLQRPLSFRVVRR